MKGCGQLDIKPLKVKGLSEMAKQAIYDYIKSMDLEINTKLPQEEVLAKQLGVSRVTVRSALNELASEGIIFRRQGKGTFVNREALQIKATFNPIEDLRDVIVNSGYDVKVVMHEIEVRLPTEVEAERLRISAESEVVCIDKTFYADEHPAIYCVDVFPRDLYEGEIDEAEMSISIYDLLKVKMNKVITWDKVEILTATSEENPILKKPFNCSEAKSFLNCRVVNFDEEDLPVIYADEYIDTNIIRFNMIRQKAPK